MANTNPAEAGKSTRRQVCKHLRNKEMYYSDQPLALSAYDSGIFWCECTKKAVGPDGVFADVEECTPSRSCFER